MNKQNIILFGAPCSGKTTSLVTLLKVKKDKFPTMRLVFLTTELNARNGFEFGLRHHKITPAVGDIIISEVKPSTRRAFSAKLAAFKDFSKDSRKAAYQTGTENAANRDKYDYLIRVIASLENFVGKDYVSGEEVQLGNISELLPTDILIIDGLSPISHGIWNIIQGDKLVNDQNDYQIVQKQIKDITMELLNSTRCSVIMLAHEEIAKDNSIRICLNAGQALHGSYVGMWANSIYCYKTQAGKYCWAGKKMNISDCAPRDIPAADLLEPDFSKYNFF